MDRFGKHWEGHHEKVAAAWRERVADEDLVLLPGDFSWALKPAEVATEFEWLAALPGRKVLTKGNHDYWWPGSHRKLNELLPEGVYAFKKRSVVIDGVPIVGVRGGDFLPWDGVSPESTTKTLQKERRELLASIEHLDRSYDGDRAPICMFHYPPFRLDADESFFTRIIEDRGCSHCIYGHLHSKDEWQRVFQGQRNGCSYHLVSCDALEFEPLLLLENLTT